MSPAVLFGRASNTGRHLFAIVFFSLLTTASWAQVTASITGTVKDTSGAVVPEATVTIKHVDTGLTRMAETGANGTYTMPSLPVGQYELSAERPGFKQQVRRGIVLVVGQQAVVNLTLELGNVEQQVTVTAAAPMVNTTVSSTSGLVTEKEVKDLPLNGRSFDQLLTLNTGTTNYTANQKAPGNMFSVAGRRPEENRFLINGVDYMGTENTGNMQTPAGASGQLLGVDAVREFNVVQHTYGAEYGKRAGGQVSIVTSSGTNQLHGDVFEYLRNSKLDARNFFDPAGVPPFKRNQFGGALGGPLKRDKLFLFGNYEGFRQRLGISNVAVVPDENARKGLLPIGPNNSLIQVPDLKLGMLPFFSFWPLPNGPSLGGGQALNISNPPQQIREDFGLVHLDYNASAKDSLSINYLVDDGQINWPQGDPIFMAIAPTRAQVLSVQETRVFSPTLLNVVTLGYTRAFANQGILPTVPIATNLSFITGVSPGTIAIGGSGASSASAITTANGQKSTSVARNNFTWADDVHLMKGNHSFTAGFWAQQVQANQAGKSSGGAGTINYPTLLAFLQDAPTQFTAIPNMTPLGFRSTQVAWYVQDEIKLRPNLTMRVGLRDEMTTGWNEAHGRAANYLFDANGNVLTDPAIGPSALTQNNAKSLWQPRVGLAWDPTGTGTWAVRAGAGIYNSLQDNLGNQFVSNPPFNGQLATTAPLLSYYPLPGGTQPLPNCNAQLQAAGQRCVTYSPAGIEPNMHTPTIQEWSLTVERAITSDIMLQVNYVGSQAYHLLLNVDMNVPVAKVCADPQGCASGGAGKTVGHVPQGTTYLPPGPLPNPYVANTMSWFFNNNSSYHGGSLSVVKRASRGLTFKTNYTFSKTMDLNSAPGKGTGSNQPSMALYRYNLDLNKGIAAFSIQHQFNGNFSYELPFGHGQRWGAGASGFMDKMIGGWQWNGILTAQGGFPFTPVVGSNISGTGDINNPDVPNHNPAFTGPVTLGKVKQWYDPHAFLLPAPGTFGNVSRGSMREPGLTEFDTSLFKKISINERWNLQFRAEAFNIFNRANLGLPNVVVFSGGNINPSAGLITNTATTSRQLQFALKLLF